MADEFFSGIGPIEYEGPDSNNPLAFRWYDPNRQVLGKSMADQLRIGVCYWHSFNWPGADIFGEGTFDRPWLAAGADPMEAAKAKMAAAFEFFTKLGTPFYSFHDRDIAPEGSTFAESSRNLAEMVDLAGQYQADTGVDLLWGTANLFSHRRFMSGAATNPDPELFAYAAAQVCQMLDATNTLGGANYVLWGGREGYETLLNTDLSREQDQLARFLTMVVEHKHKIGFTGTLLIEPKPQEPTKHQYDYDVSTVFGFLHKYGLQDEFAVNIEVNHATLSGHDFPHEVASAVNLGIFGSVDANAGDDRLGWDLDRFPQSVELMSLGLYEILRGGGFDNGGLLFDTKLRRQSIDRADLFHGHIAGIDVVARSLLVAADLIERSDLADNLVQRYSGWDGDLGRRIMAGDETLQSLFERQLDAAEPQPTSGRQEVLENTVMRSVDRAK